MNNLNFSDISSKCDTSIEGVELQLPYDHLLTTDAPIAYENRRSNWKIPGEAAAGSIFVDDPSSFLISACILLLYKYTGQREIPLSITIDDDGGDSFRSAIHFSLSSNEPFQSFQRAVRDQIASEAGGSLLRPTAGIAVKQKGQVSPPASGHPADDEMGRNETLRAVFDVSDTEVGIELQWCKNRFDASTIERINQHLLAALNTALQKPFLTLSQFDLLSKEDKAWFSDRCIGEDLTLSNEPVNRRVAALARRIPEKVAVIHNDRSQTYAELIESSRHFTAVLFRKGVVPGSRIAVCLDPCLEYPSILLAVLDYGCVYVPLNPAFPQKRIDAMLLEVGAQAVVTSAAMKARVDFGDTALIEIDSPEAIRLSKTDVPVSKEVSLDDPASVFFTSGSTGRPKAVQGSHRNVLNMMTVSRRLYGFSEADVIPAVASFTFSISMFELMTPLTSGATSLILDREDVTNWQKMADTLTRVTVFHIGPSLLRGIVNYIKKNVSDISIYRGVRHASSGGDMVPPELLTDMRDVFASAEVYVIYGCSEISIMGCSYRVFEKPVPRTFVGKVFENGRLLLLDDDNNLSPLGAVGDVCLGGVGVVEGYINRRNLNEQLFFEHDGVRFYRTGDRGRLHTKGDLELLGRRDFQIQIRGMRVELGEIDYHLRKCSGVTAGVVSAQTWHGGDDRLVAYYVPDESASVTAHTLREELSEHLPDYMVPMFYVELEALPLNQNMKIDRKSLPRYQLDEQRFDESRNSPMTASETALAEIWSDILKIAPIVVEDNFMLLGGDSIQAIEMILLIEMRTGVKLDGMAILRESLEVLARIVDSESGVERCDIDSRRKLRHQIYPAESRYFGRDNSLYGLFNAAIGQATGVPVLICPALGHEDVRSYYFLKLLASDLAAQGIPVFRFDYFGSGDSLGENEDGDIERWLQDIRSACRELMQRTASDEVRVLGVRLGATLAMKALDHSAVRRSIFWDPINNAEQHFVEQERMQRELEDKHLVIRNLRRPRRDPGYTELLGFNYNSEVLANFAQLDFLEMVGESGKATHCVLTGESDSHLNSRLSPCVIEKQICQIGWYDSNKYTATISNKSLQIAMTNAAAGK